MVAAAVFQSETSRFLPVNALEVEASEEIPLDLLIPPSKQLKMGISVPRAKNNFRKREVHTIL